MQAVVLQENDLIGQNMRLVPYLARKYFNLSPSQLEDIISSGYIGLIKASRRYDATRGTSFPTFASICILNEMRMYLRRENKRRETACLDSPIAEGNLTLIDVLADESDGPEQSVEKSESINRLYASIRKLSERERFVLTAVYGLSGSRKMKQREVSQNLGTSQANVSRIVQKAQKRLRAEVWGNV